MPLWDAVLCFGDSLTEGTRSHAGYPEYLSRYLRGKTGKIWICVNRGIRQQRTIDLLRRLDAELRMYNDIFVSTLLIGTNDLKINSLTEPSLFEELYRQVLERLYCKGHVVFVATIPDIKYLSCFPFGSDGRNAVKRYNEIIKKLCKEFKFFLIDLSDLPDECYADGLHFNELGCQKVAAMFGEAILKR